MRVYTTQHIKHHKTRADGSLAKSYSLYHAGAFFEVDDDLGESWVRDGLAQLATLDNKVLEDIEDEPEKKKTKKKKANVDVTASSMSEATERLGELMSGDFNADVKE